MRTKQLPTYTALILFLISVLISLIAGWGLAVNARFLTAHKIYDDYNEQAVASYEALSNISRHIGYGGFIHHFKNYVLRRDENYIPTIEADLADTFSEITRLEGLLSEPADRAALAKLRTTFEEYRGKYELAKKMVSAGADSTAIDRAVRVDDSPAVEARAFLLRGIVARSATAKEASTLALEAAEDMLRLGSLFLIPIVAVGWLSNYFLQRIVLINTELAEARAQADMLLETAPDPMLAVGADGHIRRANAMAVKYYGYPKEKFLGMKVETLLPEKARFDHDDSIRSAFLQAPTSRSMGQGRSLKTLLANGEERDVAISLSHFRLKNETLATVVLRDITEQKRAEEELRLAASVFHNSAEGVLVTDANGVIVSVNPAFTDLTGYTESEALGKKPSLMRSDRHGPDFYKAMWLTLVETGCWQGEIWNRKKSGEAYLERLTINRIDDSDGNPARYASVFHDITELRRTDERFRHLALHDALTGLPNRTLLQERLQHALERAKREEGGMAVMFMDLDRFKAVNDSFGHEVGDLLLQEVAQRIKARLRASDTLARLGGDEFVVLLEVVGSPSVCASLAEEIIAVVSQSMELRGHCVQVGASVGIALFPKDGVEAVDLLKNADIAMYAAKAAGRNTYRLFLTEMLASPSNGAAG